MRYSRLVATAAHRAAPILTCRGTSTSPPWPTGSDGRDAVLGARRGAAFPPRFLRLAAIGAGRGRALSRALLAARLGDRSRPPVVLFQRRARADAQGGRAPHPAAVAAALRRAVAQDAPPTRGWRPAGARPRNRRRGRRSRPCWPTCSWITRSDCWMAREFPGACFERYCDDAVVHCASEDETRLVLDAIVA